MNDKIKKLKAELEQIKKRHGGKFGPQDVVEYARNPKTELHSRFEWDDKIAGEQYRIQQAMLIIRRLQITVVENESETIKIRAYSSLTNERGPDGSYRSTVQIISDDEMKAQLLDDKRRQLVGINNEIRAITMASKHLGMAIKTIERDIKKLRPATAHARRG